MRVVIKGADFSAVSIGKIVKDLSFVYHDNEAVNIVSGETVAVDYYTGSPTSDSLTITHNEHRALSNFIEVTAGMTLVMTGTWGNTANVPDVVSYDANKNVLSPSKCHWCVNSSGEYSFSFVIPSGVSYIRLQTTGHNGDGVCTGSMPVQ